MQVLIQATVIGGSRRHRAATADKPAATYAEVHIATDIGGNKPEDCAGQTVDTLRLADARLIDMLRHAKLPSKFLIVADQQTYGEATRTVVTDIREPLKLEQVAKAG